MKKSLILIATWFYVGKIKKASGTWGTLAALPLSLLLNFYGPLVTMVCIFVLLPVGVFAAEFYENYTHQSDSSEIVIDEVVGFLITMTWLPLTWQAYFLGFVLFRIFDILKPFPIGYLDRKVSGGLGVIIDDVAAGIIANFILQMIYTHTNWLGSQMVTITS